MKKILMFVLMSCTALASASQSDNFLEIYVRAPKHDLTFRSPAALAKGLQKSGGDLGHSAMKVNCRKKNGRRVKFQFGVQGDFDTLSKFDRERLVVKDTDTQKISDKYIGENQRRSVVSSYFNQCDKSPEDGPMPVHLKFKINPEQCENIAKLRKQIRNRSLQRTFSLAAHPFCGLSGSSHREAGGGVCATMSFSFLQAVLPENDSTNKIISKSTRQIYVPTQSWLNWGPRSGDRLHKKIQVLAPQDLHANLTGLTWRYGRSRVESKGCYRYQMDISDRKAPKFNSLKERCADGAGSIVKNPAFTHKSKFTRLVAESIRKQIWSSEPEAAPDAVR